MIDGLKIIFNTCHIYYGPRDSIQFRLNYNIYTVIFQVE